MKKLFMFFFALTFFMLGPVVGVNAATYDGKTLDTGIYWFGRGNVSEKAVSGKDNPYFNPGKPTMIYIHGWQKESYKTLFRETFNPSKNDSFGADVNSADYWINKGWNIGIFYWNQLADEFEVKDAESKIWSINGPKGMRWRDSNGNYVTYDVPDVSIGQLFVQAYTDAMKDYYGSEIRIGGHSLGNQVAINAPKLLPNRVALFDPFYSKGEKSFLGNRWTGEVCREYVTELKKKNIVFEQYKSSNINDLWVGDSNEGMKQLTAFIDLYPDYTGFINQGSKHGASRDLYFYSMAFNPPVELRNGISTGNAAGYASTNTSRIREMMNSSNKWIQNGGKNTNTPGDDTFDVVNK